MIPNKRKTMLVPFPTTEKVLRGGRTVVRLVCLVLSVCLPINISDLFARQQNTAYGCCAFVFQKKIQPADSATIGETQNAGPMIFYFNVHFFSTLVQLQHDK